MENLIIWAPVMGVVALAYAFILAARVSKSLLDDDRMREISDRFTKVLWRFLLESIRFS